MQEAASFLPALMVKTRSRLAILEFGASLKRQHMAKEERSVLIYSRRVCVYEREGRQSQGPGKIECERQAR